jgi:hypothetical protein
MPTVTSAYGGQESLRPLRQRLPAGLQLNLVRVFYTIHSGVLQLHSFINQEIST